MADQQPWSDYKPAAPTPPAAAAAGPWSDYAVQTPAASPGYFETLGNDLSSIPGILRHPIDTAKGILSGSLDQAHKALDLMKQGKWADAGDALPRAIPILGPLAGSIKDDIDAGRFAPALARMTELFAPKIAEGAKAAVAAVPAVAVDAVKAAAAAGGKDIAVGSLKAATGGGAMVAGHFVGGEAGALAGGFAGKDLLSAGRKQVTAGLRSAYSAGKDKISPPEVPTAPNPYAAGTATAATNAPEALTAPLPASAAPAEIAPQYFAPTSTGPLPAPPVQAAPAPVNPYASTNAPAALVSPAIAPEPIPAQPANPYFSGGGTAAPVPGSTTMPTPAPVTNPVPLQPEAAAAVPPSTTTPYTSSGDALKAKYEGNAAAADEVKANWLLANKPGMTGADLKPGSEFKALVDQIPNPNAKSGKFTTRVNDPDHPLRVKAVADLLDSKLATQASVKNAAALSAKGITAKAADAMTPEQLGVTDSKAAADVKFQLRKLEAAAAPKP